MLKRRKLPSKNRTKQITVKFAFKNSSVGDLQVESSTQMDRRQRKHVLHKVLVLWTTNWQSQLAYVICTTNWNML